ncbi:MAG: iron ABC transporter permease [Myxococcota bacterium]
MKHLTAGRLGAVLLASLGVLVVCLAIGLVTGPSGISPGAALDALLHPAESGALADIVWRIRVPRLLLAAGVGASLAVSGVIFQALLRNPLADPFILGVSGGAALGGISVLVLGTWIGVGAGAAPLAAFAGAIGTTLLLYGMAAVRGRVSATQLLLTGVVFNAFASAGIVFLASIAGLADGSRIFLWLIGNLSAARTDMGIVVGVFLVVGLGVALSLARGLNLLALGDEAAAQLGMAVERQKKILLLATSLMVGAAVSVSGLVGFVGLIVPHLLRLVLGPDHRLLVPASALLGAAFLVLCDTLARSLLGGRELPVGAITALVGGPLFLVLLRRNSDRSFTA